MKQKQTGLVDEHLETLKGMQEAVTDDFFYARLKAKMKAREQEMVPLFQTKGKFILKPVWVIGLLIVLLGLNGYMLTQQTRTKSETSSTASTLSGFAQSYDQTINSFQ